MFNESINYNIKYTEYNATKDEIRQAAIDSNAINFIEKDEGFAVEDGDEKEKVGFERSVGVKGSKLSGGQKQRLAIARAVLKKPNAYLFDEATSALDSKSEKVVMDALSRLSHGKTTISIAHRMGAIEDCDVIFVIGGKKVLEKGGFNELLDKQGVFWKLNQEE